MSIDVESERGVEVFDNDPVALRSDKCRLQKSLTSLCKQYRAPPDGIIIGELSVLRPESC